MPQIAYTAEAIRLVNMRYDAVESSITDYCEPAHLLARRAAGSLLALSGVAFVIGGCLEMCPRLTLLRTWYVIMMFAAFVMVALDFCCQRHYLPKWQSDVGMFRSPLLSIFVGPVDYIWA